VVVGDDDVDALFPGEGGEGDGLDAAVDADDERGPPLDRDTDVLVLDAVAVGQTLGDEIIGLGPERRQGLQQHDRREHPVDVVVAEDEDLLAAVDRGPDAVDGPVHPLHQERIMKAVETAMEKGAGGLGGQDVPVGQDAGDGRRKRQGLGEGLRLGAGRTDDPQGGVHGALTLA
jgi:hypothetical protein